MHSTGNLIADTICRTAELGLTITGAADTGDRTIITANPVTATTHCPACSQPGTLRDHTTRRLVDLPVVGYPTELHIRVPRYCCTTAECPRRIFQGSLTCADDGSTVTHRVTGWILQRLAIDRMSISATAKALGVSWGVVNRIAATAVTGLVYSDPHHFDGIRILGVDEHVWKHTHRAGESSDYVTVLVDLTPVADGTGPARLVDMAPGRSADVLRRWLAKLPDAVRSGIQIVAMDGFTGYATAVGDTLPSARTVMDPFHVVHLAAEKLTRCRQRVQQDTTGRRGRRADPLYKNRKSLLTRRSLLNDKQKDRLDVLWAFDPDYVPLEVTWRVYQRIIDAYNASDARTGKRIMQGVMRSLRAGVPSGLRELAQLGRTLWRRRVDILAYFDVGASNGPVEAINGRLEHLRGIALGFRNLKHYILRSLIHSGQLQDRINAL